MAARFHGYDPHPSRWGYDRVPLAAVCSGGESSHQSAESYSGCSNACRYCLPLFRHWSAEYDLPSEYACSQQTAQPRTLDPLNVATINRRVAAGWGAMPPVYLSLGSDPYPAIETSLERTRRAITLLHRYRIGARILTKSGIAAVRDFQPRPGTPLAGGEGAFVPPLNVDSSALTFSDPPDPDLGSHPEDAFGATLTFLDADDSRRWEPGAALPAERMEGLAEAHRRGIQTWANLCPVIDPEQTLELIRETSGFVGLYSVVPMMDVAAMNPETRALAPDFDFADFAAQAVSLCRSLDIPCFVRKPEPVTPDDADAIAFGNSIMTREIFAECCKRTRPRYVTTTPEERDAALAEAHLFRYRV